MKESRLINPMPARVSSPELVPAAMKLNFCRSCRRPPRNIASPIPSDEFPTMEPVMEALTTS